MSKKVKKDVANGVAEVKGSNTDFDDDYIKITVAVPAYDPNGSAVFRCKIGDKRAELVESDISVKVSAEAVFNFVSYDPKTKTGLKEPWMYFRGTRQEIVDAIRDVYPMAMYESKEIFELLDSEPRGTVVSFAYPLVSHENNWIFRDCNARVAVMEHAIEIISYLTDIPESEIRLVEVNGAVDKNKLAN